MRTTKSLRGRSLFRWAAVGLFASCLAVACGGGEETTGIPTVPGTGGTGGTGATGGAGGTGATGGGGTGGVAPTGGPVAADIVNAGEQASSANYRLVFTFGQATQNQGKTTSPNYRIQGGLIGAQGSLP